MKIVEVRADNRRREFEVVTECGGYGFPYAKLDIRPTSDDPVAEVYPEPEAGNEAFTCRLESGSEDTVHIDAVLEYNRDPAYLKEVLLHRLTLEALEALEETELSRRELIRRLETSASQFYRLLDPANTHKSLGQMLALLHLLDREVEVTVRRTRAS